MSSSEQQDESSGQGVTLMPLDRNLPKKFVEFEIRRRLRSLRKCMYVPSLGRIDELVTTTNFMSEQLGNIAEILYSVGKSVLSTDKDETTPAGKNTCSKRFPRRKTHTETVSSDDEGISYDQTNEGYRPLVMSELSSSDFPRSLQPSGLLAGHVRRRVHARGDHFTKLAGDLGHLADDEDDESSGFGSDASDLTFSTATPVEQPTHCRTKAKLMLHDNLPPWLKNNEFIVGGHRPPSYSYKACLRSVLGIHSETGNIWSHGLGAIGFALYATYFFYAEIIPGLNIYDQLAFAVFFSAAIGCMGMSAIYHTLACHSHKVCDVTCKLDFTGITILIFGSFYPWLYYTFYDHPVLRCLYGLLGTVSALATIKMNLTREFAEARYRGVRSAVYIAYAMICGVLPVVHFVCIYNVQKLFTEYHMTRFCCMVASYVVGALIYSVRIPEKYWPGGFDYVGQSHQIMHVCVVLGNLAHVWGCLGLAYDRHLRLKAPEQESIFSTMTSSLAVTKNIFSQYFV